MALSGLDIYKLLPKTNCRECGFVTCLAFAMQLAKKAVSIDNVTVGSWDFEVKPGNVVKAGSRRFVKAK